MDVSIKTTLGKIVFDESALQKIAGEKLHKKCTSITMLDRQSAHDIYVLGMEDGSPARLSATSS